MSLVGALACACPARPPWRWRPLRSLRLLAHACVCFLPSRARDGEHQHAPSPRETGETAATASTATRGSWCLLEGRQHGPRQPVGDGALSDVHIESSRYQGESARACERLALISSSLNDGLQTAHWMAARLGRSSHRCEASRRASPARGASSAQGPRLAGGQRLQHAAANPRAQHASIAPAAANHFSLGRCMVLHVSSSREIKDGEGNAGRPLLVQVRTRNVSILMGIFPEHLTAAEWRSRTPGSPGARIRADSKSQ